MIASFVHNFVDMCEFKLEFESGNAQIGTLSTIFKPLTPDLTFCMDFTFINGDNSWKLHDDTMSGTL